MTRRTRVYIAGPYTKGDVAVNVGNAMAAWGYLWELGYSPYCPHLSHFLHLHKPRPYADWLAFDLDWLAVCDGLLRLPGESSGADEEVRAAEARGIPVFRFVNDLMARLPRRQEDA